MMRSLLIANRGEIACRIIRTARRLGVRTLAVYSDADAAALHVIQADAAVRIGPAPARDSYLVGERIIEAARQSGAEAIHPGYGFLSENAEFAQAVIDAGLVWVGPRPASIRAMGLKDAAKRLMQEAGVPTTPGYLGDDQSPARLKAEAEAIGYPVLIKAVAGGGGKGMRRVDEPASFEAALASCRREAAAAFGDDRVLLETYISRPRHIEVQVFGDTHGNVVHLFERDCSLQRRHQKVIEEAPAPGMDEPTRRAICMAAVQAARAVDYVGAGTVEFIADASDGLRADRVWFMEMNTRLQVEHPVTEAITGVDLVEWQLRAASGEPLPMRQEELSIRGYAIEARLYAEDPASGFLPSTGPLRHFRLPDGVRVDTSVGQGDEITPFYDPMIAKLIAHGPGRADAARKLAEAAGQVEVWPVRTNAGFLARTLADPGFLAGDVDTGFIERHAERLVPSGAPPDPVLEAAARALVEAASSEPLGAWGRLPGFRLNAEPSTGVVVAHGAHEHRVVPGQTARGPSPARAVLQGDGSVLAFAAGEAFRIAMLRAGAGQGGAGADGAILSPMPGKVIVVSVAEGDAVAKGQPLVTVEAMKMEHTLSAPFDGHVAQLAVSEGAQVQEGARLLVVERAEGERPPT